MMERLTERDEDGYIHKIGECSLVDCYNKLGRLENIEDELGIPLEVLFKALKEGIYYDHKHRNPESISFRFCCNDLIVEYTCFGCTDYDYLEIKDYGKTWALTKEELENAKD